MEDFASSHFVITSIKIQIDALKKILSCMQVYSIVDEMFLAGELRETSQTKVWKETLL